MQVRTPCPGALGMTMAAHAHPSAGAVEGEQANLLIQRGFLEYVQLEQMDNKKKTSDLSKDVSSLRQV